MSEEKFRIDLDLSFQYARLIYDCAVHQAHCREAGTTSDQLKITSEHIRDAANLIFLTLDLIKEWNAR